MGQFKPMVKMMTDEPSVILKLKKGGKVKSAGQADGFKSMAGNTTKMFDGAEDGKAPKKPSMAERRRAMNPNQYAKGGKVAHKQMGGGMPAAMPVAPGAVPGAMPVAPAPMRAMGRQTLAGMAPAKRAMRAAQVRKALTGMKKGGSADCASLEKELKHHEAMSAMRAHGKASGGAIDKAATKTTIEGNAGKFAKTKMDTSKKDRAHGTGGVKEGNAGGYKSGGNVSQFAKTKMVDGDKADKAHGTGGVKMGNAGGFKKGGKVPGLGNAIEGGNWENRPANSAKPGKTNGTTGGVKEGNGGGYKMGGRASKKAFATGGNVVDDGKAEKMPRHFVSRPVANSLQSGTFKSGGKVEKEEKPNLRLLKTHTGPKGHVAKVYKDKDWGEHRVKFFDPDGKHRSESDYHTDDLSDAHDTATSQLNRYKGGGKVKFSEGGSQDLSKGAYDRHYANEKKENEAMRESILGAPKRAYEAVKGMFSSPKPPEGSVTKTKESVTVAPRKRGGSAKC